MILRLLHYQIFFVQKILVSIGIPFLGVFHQLNSAWCGKIVFGTGKMITETFCTPVDSWGA